MVAAIGICVGVPDAVASPCTGNAMAAPAAVIMVKIAWHSGLLADAADRVGNAIDVVAGLVAPVLDIQAAVAAVVRPTIAVMF